MVGCRYNAVQCDMMLDTALQWLNQNINQGLIHWGQDKMAATLTDDTFKNKFVNKNVLILIKISLKFVPKGPINNIPSLVQKMAWRQPGDKPLSEPMMV